MPSCREQAVFRAVVVFQAAKPPEDCEGLSLPGKGMRGSAWTVSTEYLLTRCRYTRQMSHATRSKRANRYQHPLAPSGLTSSNHPFSVAQLLFTAPSPPQVPKSERCAAKVTLALIALHNSMAGRPLHHHRRLWPAPQVTRPCMTSSSRISKHHTTQFHPLATQ